MNIEDIQVGDFVYSYDTITGTFELKEVTAVFSLVSDHINYITIVDEHGNEQVIETTDGHPFWVVTDEPDLERAAQGVIDENGAILYHNNIAPTEHGFWVEAKDLREGDVFLGANGELSTVVSIERVEFPDGIAVYNLTVDGNHNYFVIAQCDEYGQTSVLVHNAGYGEQFDGPATPLVHTSEGNNSPTFGRRLLNELTTSPVRRLDNAMNWVESQSWGKGLLEEYFNVERVGYEALKWTVRELERHGPQAPDIMPHQSEYLDRPWAPIPEEAVIEAAPLLDGVRPHGAELRLKAPTGGGPLNTIIDAVRNFRLRFR